MVCALDVVCFADCCCSVVAERHFHFAHWKFCASRSLVARWGGGTPFWSAHWRLFASRSIVGRQWRNAFLLCALDVVCFAVCCCSAVAERLFALRTGHYSLRGLLLPGCGIPPFHSAHWRLFALRSVVVRWWRNAFFILHIGHSLLRNPLQLGNRGRARCA